VVRAPRTTPRNLPWHHYTPVPAPRRGAEQQSYLENRKPAAGRIYWVYGPGRKEITIISLEPHPEDKKRGGYDKVSLSDLPGEA